MTAALFSTSQQNHAMCSKTVAFVLENTSPTVAGCEALHDHVSGFLF